MKSKQIGYGRVSPGNRDRAKQRLALEDLGVPAHNVFLEDEKGAGVGLDRVVSLCRRGDTFVVTGFERFAGTLATAAVIIGSLLEKGVVINLGGKNHDPADPVARRLPQDLLLAAALEAGLVPRDESRAALLGDRRSDIKRDPVLDPEHEDLLVMMLQSRAYICSRCLLPLWGQSDVSLRRNRSSASQYQLSRAAVNSPEQSDMRGTGDPFSLQSRALGGSRGMKEGLTPRGD